MPELSILTGISTIFGLIGVILYVIIRVISSTENSILTPDLISALKSTNINSNDLKNLSSKKIKLIIENQTNISSTLIEKGIVKEIYTKTTLLKATMIGCFILAIVFFIISQFNGQEGKLINLTKNDSLRQGDNLIINTDIRQDTQRFSSTVIDNVGPLGNNHKLIKLKTLLDSGLLIENTRPFPDEKFRRWKSDCINYLSEGNAIDSILRVKFYNNDNLNKTIYINGLIRNEISNLN